MHLVSPIPRYIFGNDELLPGTLPYRNRIKAYRITNPKNKIYICKRDRRITEKDVIIDFISLDICISIFWKYASRLDTKKYLYGANKLLNKFNSIASITG